MTNSHRLLNKAFILFCFFPYIQLVPSEIDSQPYALLLGIIILLFNKIYKYNTNLSNLLLICIFGILFYFFSPFNLNSLRSAANYISLFIIPTASYHILKTNKSLTINLFKKIVLIWLIFGIIQLVIFPSFGSFLISRMSLGELESGRGVTSLAPEPTFYGIICALLSIVCFLNFKKCGEYKMLQIIIWSQLLLISRSTTVIMISGLSYIIYKLFFLFKNSPKSILGLIILSFIIVSITPIVLSYLQNYRIGKLLGLLIENPELFLLKDESVNERFIHAYFPIYGFIENYGLPHFYGGFNEYMKGVYQHNPFSEYIIYYRNDYTRIMSGLGSIMFELGIISLLLLKVLFSCFHNIYNYDKQIVFFGGLFLFTLLNAMPLSNALVGFVIGNFIYVAQNTKIIFKSDITTE